MCDKYAMISHHSLHCNTSHTLKNLNLCYPYKYKALIVLNLESKELKVEGTIMTWWKKVSDIKQAWIENTRCSNAKNNGLGIRELHKKKQREQPQKIILISKPY